MEKLIELHRQFLEETGKSMTIYSDWKLWYFYCLDTTYDHTEWAIQYLISKEYWFIERLSENFKINFHKSVFTSDWNCDRDDIFYQMHYNNNLDIINEQYWVQEPDCIIMYLSVEENPVETLISMLREWD